MGRRARGALISGAQLTRTTRAQRIKESMHTLTAVCNRTISEGVAYTDVAGQNLFCQTPRAQSKTAGPTHVHCSS